MRAKLLNVWQNALSSLWFVPGSMVVGAIILAAVLLFVDRTVTPGLANSITVIFGGTAQAARTLLSTITGSLITVVSIAFSVTLLALQQAATQYSPRVLRNFTRDRGNQIVLGSYLATFTYALVVLREVRDPAAQSIGFVPSLSVSMALLLALMSVLLLVYFIDHIASALQASTILAAIHEEVGEEISHLFPSEFGRDSRDPPAMSVLLRRVDGLRRGRETVIRSDEAGYLRLVDEAQLSGNVPPDGVHLVWVPAQIGDYIQRGMVIARIWADGPIDEEQREGIRDAFVLDAERTIHQDIIFGLRQMVDIGVKALSPGINDPTTAEQSISVLRDSITRLMGREFPSPLRQTDRGSYFLFARPGLRDYVDVAFGQIQRAAKDQLHVILLMLDVLGQLIRQAPNEERGGIMREQVTGILNGIPLGRFAQSDEQTLRERIREVLAMQPRGLPEPAQAA